MGESLAAKEIGFMRLRDSRKAIGGGPQVYVRHERDKTTA